MKTFLLFSIICMCLQSLRGDEAKSKLVYKPTVMSVMIGGSFGRTYEITYDGRQLRYYSAKSFFDLETAKPVVIKPTEDQWQSFFDELERIKVWNWKRRYENPSVHDGTYWRAFITYPTREARDLVSSGSNAYPADFKVFLAAVRKLIGGRKFE